MERDHRQHPRQVRMTDEEYERWILGDPALERRFQKIAVRDIVWRHTQS
jgi:ATP-dependent Clp protease ATP-binding subunit ClpA